MPISECNRLAKSELEMKRSTLKINISMYCDELRMRDDGANYKVNKLKKDYLEKFRPNFDEIDENL